MPRTPETFRTLYLDPGEDFGWAVGRDLKLLARGTGKMFDVVADIWDVLKDPSDTLIPFNSMDYARDGVTQEELLGPIERIVYEEFRIYPWKCKELKFDEVRTAQAIGAIRLACMPRFFNIPCIGEGANIKEAAVAAGAEELYDTPLHENRHQNDAIQHFVYWTNVNLLGMPIKLSNPSPDNT